MALSTTVVSKKPYTLLRAMIEGPRHVCMRVWLLAAEAHLSSMGSTSAQEKPKGIELGRCLLFGNLSLPKC